MDDKFQDVMRVLNMLAKSTAEFQQLQTSMSNPVSYNLLRICCFIIYHAD